MLAGASTNHLKQGDLILLCELVVGYRVQVVGFWVLGSGRLVVWTKGFDRVHFVDSNARSSYQDSAFRSESSPDSNEIEPVNRVSHTLDQKHLTLNPKL